MRRDGNRAWMIETAGSRSFERQTPTVLRHSRRRRGVSRCDPAPAFTRSEQAEMARSMMANPKLSARQVAEELGVHRATLYRNLGGR